MRMIVVLVAAALSGCVTRSGPFVMNISQSAPGELTIEKCFAEFNSFSATTNTGDCTVQRIVIGK